VAHLGLLPGAHEHRTPRARAHQWKDSWGFQSEQTSFQSVNLSCNENIQLLSARIQSSTQAQFRNRCFSRAYHPRTPPIPTTRVPPSPTGPPQRTEISHRGPHLQASRPTGRSILYPHPARTYDLCSKNNPFPLEEGQLPETLSAGNNSVQKQRRGRSGGQAAGRY